MLTAQAIEEFKKIYQEEEGILLSDDVAEEVANRLFDLFVDLTTVRNAVNNET